MELPQNFEADGIFMTSGADKAIDTALKYVRSGGKILVFSSTPKNFGYANNEIYYRELTVMGSYSPDLCDMRKSLELLQNGSVKVTGLSTIYPLDELEQAIKDTKSAKIMKAYIKLALT